MRGGPARAVALLVALAAAAALPAPAPAQESHALIVVGIGGGDAYVERFHEWASSLRDALVERHGLAAERVTYLGEHPDVDAPSRRENVEEAIGKIVAAAGPDDRVLLVIFGHGTSRGDEALVNLPGPDVSDAELAELLAPLSTQQVAIVNTTSASGPFVATLSGPGRIVITATRTAQERNETWFGRYFVAAFTGEDADLDKDGRVSLLEAYQYATREVARHYETQGLLMTEHALIDDNGDRRGSGEPDVEAGDGRVAGAFAFGRLGSTNPANVSDPVLRGLFEERAELEKRLDALRARQGSMAAEAYDRELEGLLIEIALKDQEIRLRGGGAP
jgi:hypothetical protein